MMVRVVVVAVVAVVLSSRYLEVSQEVGLEDSNVIEGRKKDGVGG